MDVLVVNAGSSSLKLRVLDGDDALIAREDLAVDEGALTSALARLPVPDAVGHRIVHGGDRYSSATVVDAGVRAGITQAGELAPLHQPKSLAVLDAVTRALPGVPAVACFDTAYHATLPPESATYAVPAGWRERWGVRRYGFHGLSHAYAARRATELVGDRADRLVSCHLGAGSSVTAIRDGRSVDTSMGFTPLEGLVMATRSGSVDPGLLLWLLERERLTESEMADALEREAGLLGLTGTADMREVLARAEQGDEEAALGLGVYVHRLRVTIAGMTASLGGLGSLLFTGGVGENAPRLRELVADGLPHLGLELDAERNRRVQDDADVATRGSAVRILVVASREDLEIARQVREILRPGWEGGRP